MNRQERKRAWRERERLRTEREHAIYQEALDQMFAIGNFRRIADKIFVEPALDRLMEKTDRNI